MLIKSDKSVDRSTPNVDRSTHLARILLRTDRSKIASSDTLARISTSGIIGFLWTRCIGSFVCGAQICRGFRAHARDLAAIASSDTVRAAAGICTCEREVGRRSVRAFGPSAGPGGNCVVRYRVSGSAYLADSLEFSGPDVYQWSSIIIV